MRAKENGFAVFLLLYNPIFLLEIFGPYIFSTFITFLYILFLLCSRISSTALNALKPLKAAPLPLNSNHIFMKMQIYKSFTIPFATKRHCVRWRLTNKQSNRQIDRQNVRL